MFYALVTFLKKMGVNKNAYIKYDIPIRIKEPASYKAVSQEVLNSKLESAKLRGVLNWQGVLK
jgi:hypothetical protein